MLRRIIVGLLAFGAIVSGQVRFNTRTDLNYGTENAPYSQQLVAAGGTAPYTYSVTAGSALPPGISLSSSGLLTGPPTAASPNAPFSFSLTVTDASSQSTSSTFDMQICPTAWAFAGASSSAIVLPAGTVGQLYSPVSAPAFTVNGACGTLVLENPYLTLVSGAMPPGLRLPYTGIPNGLYGTPTTAGTYTFTLNALEMIPNGRTATQAFQVTVNPIAALAITTTSASALINSDFQQYLQATGGYLPYTWSTSTTLPTGLTLTAGGSLEGQPTEYADSTISFTVTDGLGNTATQSIEVVVSDSSGLVIDTNAQLPAGLPNTSYSKQIGIAGTEGSEIFWSISSGNLPPGLNIDSTSGLISGTIGAVTQDTDYQFTISANAGDLGTATQNANIYVSVTPLTIDPINMFLPGTIEYPNFVFMGNSALCCSPIDLLSGTLPTGMTTTYFTEGTGFPLVDGTPNVASQELTTFSGVIRLKNSLGQVATATTTFEVTAPAPANSADVPGGILPDLIVGADYAGIFTEVTAGDENMPNTFAVTAGALPPGITLQSYDQNDVQYPTDFVLYGTPTATGTYTFTVTMTDPTGATESGQYTINVVPLLNLPVTLGPSSLPGGTQGVNYSQQLTPTNGNGPYSYSVTMGNLPPGINLNSSTGLLSGQPTSSGPFSFVIEVVDNSNEEDGGPYAATQSYSITINPSAPLTISPTSLPSATMDANYSVQLSASGGVPPYSFTTIGLPPGLTLNSGNMITGQCIGQSSTGVTITVFDSDDDTTSEGPLQLGCNPAPLITTPSPLPAGTVNVAYSATFMTNAFYTPPGAAPYSWSLSNSTLPSSFTLGSPSGVLSGTTGTARTYTFTVSFTDAWGATTSKAFSLTISSTLTITTTSLPSGVAGTAYPGAAITASGGTPPYTFSATGLPTGLNINSSGSISGTPTETGTFNPNFTVTDSAANTASKTISLTIASSAPIVFTSPQTLPSGQTGTAYSYQLTWTGGVAPFTVSPATGLLPGLSISSSGLITGTPTTGGAFTFPVTVKDSQTPNQNSTTQSFTIVVNPPTITTTSPLPAATTGVAYSDTFTATGGAGAYTWTAQGLPSWLTLSSGGALTGTPPSGTTSVTFTVTVTDSLGADSSGSFTLPVMSPALMFITTSPLPPATVSAPYSDTFMATGGAGGYTFSATGLPEWLTLASNGALTGTPPAAGPVTFSVTVTDSASNTVTQMFTLPVNSVLSITTTSPLSPATVGAKYSNTLMASGGTGVYGWTATGLPTWLSLSTAGVLSGTPPSAGPVTFNVTVTDTAQNSASMMFTFPVDATLTIANTSPLPPATVQMPYMDTFTASGGSGMYTWSATGLPEGFSLSSVGVLTGTPSAATPITFSVTVTDTLNNTLTEMFTLPVNAVLTITNTSPLPAATSMSPYSDNFTASGGSGGYTWSATALPSWLTLTAAGFLSGTPPAGATSATFSVTVTDSSNDTTSEMFTLPVNAALTINNTSPLPAATVGSAYSANFIASGGTGGYTWSATGLPSWITLSAAGLLSGTPPTGATSITFSVTVTDSSHDTATGSFTLPVNAALTINNTSPLPAATVGAAYSDTFTASGGSGEYTWSTSGLPTWLTLSAAGFLSGTPPAGTTSISFSVTVNDSFEMSVTASFTLPINASLTINNTSPLPAATIGTLYSDNFTASGGSGGYTWSATGLPAWLTLSAAGFLSGTPPAGATSVSFSVTVTDSSQDTTTGSFTLPINAALTINNTSPLSAATAGVAYTDTFTASGGTGGYTWSASGLPSWLMLSAAGVLSGTPPPGATSVSFPVTVTDSSANIATGSFTLPVNAPLVITTTSPLPVAVQGDVYSLTFTATGGMPGYAWSATGLPKWLKLSSSGLLTGTPPSGVASVSFNVTVTDSLGNLATGTFVLPVNSPLMFITTSPLPPATTNITYTDTFMATGGTGTYTFSAMGLPSWLTLASNGTLSGTPQTAGPVTFMVTVNDAESSVSQMFTLPVNSLLSITSTSPLPPASVGVAYSNTLMASGGTGGYTWSATGLQTWLTLSTAGILSGTAPIASPVTFNATVTDSSSNTASMMFTLPVNAALTIGNTSPLPPATLQMPYMDTFTASGGSGIYTWSATGLPQGFALSSSGVLTGIPSAATPITFRVTVTDTLNNSLTETFTLPVNAALTITNSSPLPAATSLVPYSDTFAASGGSGGYTWAATGLPSWLTFSAAGYLSGTPPAGVSSVTFSVTVTDSSANTATATFTLPVNTALTVNNTSPLPAASVGSPYSENFTASGGTGGYTWAATGLPSWLTLSAAGFLSGTPPTGVTSISFSVTVTDSSQETSTESFVLSVNATLTIDNTSPLPAATIGALYSDNFTASGGSGGYTWMASGLPSWLTLTAAGYLSGTPPAGAASVSFSITVSDSSNNTDSMTFTLPVNPAIAPLAITTTSPLPAATAGTTYSQQLLASGGTGSYTWTATGLPPWLTFSTSGLLTGTPPSAGSVSFTATVTDSSNTQASMTLVLPVNPLVTTLTITTTSPLPAATVGTTYSQQLLAAGGTGSYTWTASGLPTWLTLSTSGLLTGTPPSAGSVNFTATVTDSANTRASMTFVLPVNPLVTALTVTTTSPLPAATAGSPYSQQLLASGGTGSYTWTATGLPIWLSLSTSGLLTGTPPAAGSVSFTATVTDSGSDHASMLFTLPVNAVVQTLAITTTSPLPAATVGTPYSQQLMASGGMGSYAWTATGLPSWLALSTSGILTGTPASAGSLSFTITVTDSASDHATSTFTLPVNPGVPMVAITTHSPLPTATVGSSYSEQLTATGGTGGYAWTATGLPNWLTLSTDGLLSGTPTVPVAYGFTVTVTDSAKDTFSMSFTLPVNEALLLAITTGSPLPGATVGVAYSTTFAATGGSGSYSWSGSSLPAGLSLSSSGVLSGTPTSAGTFTLTISVTDSTHTKVSQAFSISISASGTALHFTTVNLPACTVGVFCSASLGATGGVPPYTFSIYRTQSISDSLILSPAGLISGTPTHAETVNFSAQVTDSTRNTVSQSFSIQVNGTALSILTTSLPAGTVGIAYSATLQATGGSSSNTWAILSGTLPAGLKLTASTGAITGTPSSAGSSTFSVQVSSGVLSSAPATFTISVTTLEPLTITSPLQLPAADVGTAYSENLSAIGGTGGYTWKLASGSLPAGLTLGSSGAIAGTPSTAQTGTFTATVADGSGNSANGQFSLTVINPAVATILTSSPLPDGLVNQPYNYSINVSGGTPPYNWSIAQGTIPNGLTFDSTSGNLSGTPTTAGAFTFTVTVTDSSVPAAAPIENAATKTYTVHIVAVTSFHITTSNPLPNGSLNTAYAETFTATSGTAPYTWQLISGSWPAGVSLDSSGNLTGTPTSIGTYSVIVQATDAAGLIAMAGFSLTIADPKLPAISITPAPENGTVGTAYSQGLSASGGTTPYVWSVSSGSLPPGLSLDSATGVISGMPTQKGSFSFTVQVTDAAGSQASQQFTIKVLSTDLTITTGSPLPNASANESYSYGLTVMGGSAPYTWSLSAGSLASGFSINTATGVLSGTPAQTGMLHFTISVTDQNFDETSKSFDLSVVSTALTITTLQTTLTTTVGANYAYSLTAAQGNSPYTWSIIAGKLPPGISLNSQTGALTGTAMVAGTYTFTVQASDATSATAQVQITLVVKPVAFAITTGSPLAAGTAGSGYSQTFASAGGTGSITWTAGSGKPPGLSLAPSTGVLSGTPTMAGDFTFTVVATDSTGAKASQNYQIHIAGPATLMATASGLPATVNPGDQPTVNLALGSAYALPITLTATLQLTPSAGANTDLLFSNGSTTMQFTIPANTTQYSFSFQAGTVAGKIQVTLTFQAAGVDVTPSPAPVLTTQIVAAAPSINSVVVTQTTSGIQAVIDGLSTTRDMKTATFQFTPAAGATLQTTSVSVDVSAMFTAWYQSASSLPLGSQFSLTVPFAIGGNVNTIASVSVTLTNSVGTSAPVNAMVP
jgi:hypothetical protein